MKKILSLTLVASLISVLCFGQTNQEKSLKSIELISEIGYYDTGISHIGFASEPAISFKGLVYFPADVISAHEGEPLHTIKVYLRNDGENNIVNNLKVCIWTDTTNAGTNTAYEQVVTNIANGWNEVELTTPYILGTEAIFVGYDMDGEGYIIGTENNRNNLEPNGYGDMLMAPSGELMHIGQIPLQSWGDLAIEVFVGNKELVNGQMNEITVASVVQNGMVDITGTFTNMGQNPITSYDVTYSLNGTASASYSVTGVNIATDEVAEFTHNVQADLSSPEEYELSVTISNINGGGETVLEDNTLSKTIFSVQEVVQKKVLYEMFTSATCAACLSANILLDDLTLNNNQDKATLIKYQVDFPGLGDPYYTEEVGERVSFYDNFENAPTLKVDGQGGAINVIYSQDLLDEKSALPSIFKIEGDASFEDGTLTADVNITPVSSFSKDLVVQIAVIENETTENAVLNSNGGNGETEFHNVMMKFLDNTEGHALSTYEAGTSQSISVSANLDNTNIEEMGDTRLVVWVQDNATKEVYQSGYIEISTQIIDAYINALSINSEKESCDLSSDVQVKTTVKNGGEEEISNFVVRYSINDNEMSSVTYTETLAPGEEVEITFDQNADFSQDGIYEVLASVDLQYDNNISNNTMSETIVNVPLISANSYTETFTPKPYGWSIEDANGDGTSWTYTKMIVDELGYDEEAGHNDSAAFMYSFNQYSAANDYLYSSCIEFEAGQEYQLSFWTKVRRSFLPEKLEVFIGSEPNKNAMNQSIINLDNITNTNYEETSVSFEVPQSGVYYLGFKAYSDADMFALLLDDVSLSKIVSVENLSEKNFEIYPNPTTGKVYIEDAEGAEVTIYNMVGEIVYRQSKTPVKATLDLSSYPNGSYLIQLVKDQRISTQKIVLAK